MKTIIDDWLFKRHFWQKTDISELNELYLALTLRVLGLGLIGIFIPVYLYGQGYSLQSMAWLYAASYVFRLFIDPLIAKFISRYGPGHILKASFGFEVIFVLSVLAAGAQLIPLWVLVFTLTVSIATFMVPFHFDFSRTENSKKAGSQISVLTVLEKTAGALGPLLGGLIAAKFGFEVSALISILVTLVAMVFLFSSNTAVKQAKIPYRFSYKDVFKIKDDWAVLGGRSFTIVLRSLLWPMFIVLAIFSGEEYLGLGLVTAVGLASTMLTAHFVGVMVDRLKGRLLLRVSTVLVSISDIAKPLITTAFGAVVLNVASESFESAQRLPFMKGYYEKADTFEEGRLNYVISSLSFLHLINIFVYSGLAVTTYFLDDIDALSIAMYLSGLGSLLALKEKYKMLDR